MACVASDSNSQFSHSNFRSPTRSPPSSASDDGSHNSTPPSMKAASDPLPSNSLSDFSIHSTGAEEQLHYLSQSQHHHHYSFHATQLAANKPHHHDDQINNSEKFPAPPLKQTRHPRHLAIRTVRNALVLVWLTTFMTFAAITMFPLWAIVRLFFPIRYWLRLSCFIQGSYHVFTMWSAAWFGDLRLRISGARLVAERSLVFSNHAGHEWIPWLTCGVLYGFLGYVRIIVKDAIKYVPGFGWGMYIFYWPFIKRKYERDVRYLGNLFNIYADHSLPLQIVLYPEGTRYSATKLAASQAVEIGKGYDVWDRVLLPRYRGFGLAARALAKSGAPCAVYDVTVGYEGWGIDPSQRRKRAPSPWDTIRSSGTCHLHIDKFHLTEIPLDSDEGVRTWLMQRFAEKERRLKYFDEHGRFPVEASEVWREVDEKIFSWREHGATILFWNVYSLLSMLGCLWLHGMI